MAASSIGIGCAGSGEVEVVLEIDHERALRTREDKLGKIEITAPMR